MSETEQRLAELRHEIAVLETGILEGKEVEKQLWRDNLTRMTEITDQLFTKNEINRRKALSHIIARRLCCSYMKRQTFLSLKEIASIVGLKSHATVIDHIKKAENMLDPVFGDRNYRLVNAEAKLLGICTTIN